MSSDPKGANIHAGHRERKKEDVNKFGIENMQPHEILEVLLYYSIPRMDTNEIAHRLIREFGSIANVFNASEKELCAVDGIGKNSAFFLRILPGVFRAYERSRMCDNIVILDSHKKIEQYVMSLFADIKVEAFYCICLTCGKRVVSTKRMATGTVDEVEVEPRELVKEILDMGAKEVIIAHNHPYGYLSFSDADRKFTKAMRDIFGCFKITMIDHYLVAEGGCLSYYTH